MSEGNRRSRHWRMPIAIAAVLLLLTAGMALAQQQTGNLFGTVTDNHGAPLPGVTLTLSGQGAPMVTTSDAKGNYHFLGLSPGTYDLKAELQGFSTVEQKGVAISINRATTANVTLQGAIQQTITVTSQTPILDTRKVTTGTTVNSVELQKIPTSRDPWAILQQTPGVMTDRINVGGSQSGQQSGYAGNGADANQSTWYVDGVEITDIGALGSSPSYYDFGAFSEMDMATGGSDANLSTPGVAINMVTKRGTNQWRGSAHYIIDKNSWQSSSGFNNSDLAAAGPWNGNTAQQPPFEANSIDKITDWGAEIGGPILKDRLFVWGSYGDQEINILQVGGLPDKTSLKTDNEKVNWQITSSNSLVGFRMDNKKIKIGRNIGPSRPPETSWDQGRYGPGPTLWKFQDSQVFGPSFYASALYSQVEGGFQLVPEGSLANTVILDQNFVWHNSYLLYQSPRPQRQEKIDASYFFNTGNVSHELKFGAGYRAGEVGSYGQWGGSGIAFNFYKAVFGTQYNVADITRPFQISYHVRYKDAYAQDTLTTGNLTVNVGLRWDNQGGKDLPVTVPANPQFPNLLPAVSVPGRDFGFTWSKVSPRLGLTYALGAEKKTLLRASYSQFSDQMGGSNIAFTNPFYYGSYVYSYYNDKNNNGVFDPGELVGSPFFYFNVNPYQPDQAIYNYKFNPNIKVPYTDEFTLGVEHTLMPQFVVGLTATYRKMHNIIYSVPLVFDGDAFSSANLGQYGRPATSNDFIPEVVTGTLPNGQTYSTTYYVLKPGVSSRDGLYFTNGGLGQTYKGVSLTLNKRLSNRWMMRGNITYDDWTWDVSPGTFPDQSQPIAGGHKNGDPVLVGSGTGSGAFGNVYLNSKWSYDFTGMYQIAPDRPWGFNISGELYGRQGYAAPYYRRVNRGDLGNFETLVSPKADSFRFPNVQILNLRIEKDLTLPQNIGLNIGLDVFNAFNNGTVLQRNLRLGTGTSNYVFETMAPRIFRIGATLTFR